MPGTEESHDEVTRPGLDWTGPGLDHPDARQRGS